MVSDALKICTKYNKAHYYCITVGINIIPTGRTGVNDCVEDREVPVLHILL